MACCAITGCVAAVVLLGAAPVRAAVSFTVSPMTSEITAEPGTEQSRVIQVKHLLASRPNGARPRPIRLRVYPMDWSLNRKGEPQFLEPGVGASPRDAHKGRPYCSSWLQISPREVIVPAGETREVRCRIMVPSGIQGTFRSIIMFESEVEPMELEGQGIVHVNGRIGSTLYVQVGPQTPRLEITGFTVTADQTTVTVENRGTNHLRLKGVLQVHDPSGRLVQQKDLPGAVVLPGENNVREIQVETPRLPGSGRYSVTVLLDYGAEELLGAQTERIVDSG
jgi:hypothetical protein